MGEIADAMISGILCGMCGQPLDCDDCKDMEIPMYCSRQCAKDAGTNMTNFPADVRVCTHK